MTGKFYASVDNEVFDIGPHDTREEALAEAMKDYEEFDEFWTGIDVPYKKVEIDADDIVSILQERAYEVAGDFSEGYLVGITNKSKEELTKTLQNTIGNWLISNGYDAQFYTMRDVKEHIREAND